MLSSFVNKLIIYTPHRVVKFDASGKPQPSGIRSPGWSFRQLELYIISDADKMDAFNLFDLIRGLLKIKGDERMTPGKYYFSNCNNVLLIIITNNL